MVLAFVTAVIDPVLKNIHFAGPEITFNELWSVFLTVCALMFFCWKAPNLAASLLGGSPHLGTGDLLQAAGTPIAAGMALGAVGGRAMAGVSAMRAATTLAPTVTSARSPVTAAASNLGVAQDGKADHEKAGAGGAGKAFESATPTAGASASLVQSALGTTAKWPPSSVAAPVPPVSPGSPSPHAPAAS
jgi:type IV secretion system protein TrbL